MTFDPVLHEYRDGDVIIPSVHQILEEAGYIDNRWYSIGSSARGKEIHVLCEDYANGARYDLSGEPLENMKYVNAFARFMNDFSPKVLHTETRIYGEIDGFRYAGTYDLLAEIKKGKALIDIKTGAKASWHHIQLAAYALQVNPNSAMILYIKSTGRYSTVWLTPDELIDGAKQFRKAIAKIKEAKDEFYR